MQTGVAAEQSVLASQPLHFGHRAWLVPHQVRHRNAYPKASVEGSYGYHKIVSLSGRARAFEKAFHSTALDLDRRVVFIHGVR